MVIFDSMITHTKNRQNVNSLLLRVMALCLFFVFVGSGYGARVEAPLPEVSLLSALTDSTFTASHNKADLKESFPLASQESIPDRWHQRTDKRYRSRPFLMLSAGRQELITVDCVIHRQYRTYAQTVVGNDPVLSSPRGPPCA